MDITLGEVSRGISDLKKSNDKLHEKVDSIVIQTTRTNGRVGVLEKIEKENEKVRDQFKLTKGGLIILSFLFTSLVAVSIFTFKVIIKNIVVEVLKERAGTEITLK